jgi:hypothetical protein
MENYLNTFIWVSNLKGRQISGRGAVGTKEYVLAYSKMASQVGDFRVSGSIVKELMPSVYKGFDYEIQTDERGPYVLKNQLYNTNSAFNEVTRKMSMASTGPYINTDFAYTSIDVNLSNQTVTSNVIEIPVNIDTKGNSVGGLQLEFIYDPNKIKFEELASTLPSSWYVFANSKNGVVKFGALDQNNSNPIKGTNMPFKLKFSTIGNGVDVLTSLKVSQTMDAADNKGNQLGVVLNMTNIKLTGYNNF